MEEGTSQGCPLSPLFASFVVARLLEPIDKLLRERAGACLATGDKGDDGQGGISHLLSFVDDNSSCVYLPDFDLFCEQVRSRGASIGCFVNPHKTRVLTSCNGTSILSTLTIHDPLLAQSLSTSIASIQQHHFPPTNLHLISPLNSLLASGSLANPLGLLHLRPNSSIDALMTSKKNIFPT
jgi:hypothetical protein